MESITTGEKTACLIVTDDEEIRDGIRFINIKLEINRLDLSKIKMPRELVGKI